MSPEQAERERILDDRTDTYSLGATLYELLTTRPAFDGDNRHELIWQIAVAEPVAPCNLDPAIPRDLETICVNAMAKEPEQHYSTARELASGGFDLRCDCPRLCCHRRIISSPCDKIR
jgi:eukaryotic-like serine/threonine-protein kinase